ncbi:MAG TPA: CDC27 family protein, partial [Flavobacteriales bacterium]|nr:CDC27 family protein [Flavobacteriales bacterium]
MRKILATAALSLLCTTLAVAQNKQAEEADAAYKAGQYFNAIEMYKKAYTSEKKASEKAILIYKVAECYRVLGDAPNAQVWYEKANKAQYTDPITYYWIGEALKEQGKYAEAISAYNKYKEKNPGDKRADASLAACQLAQTWKDSPSRYTVDPEVL